MMAPPAPISRRSFFLPHVGHVFFMPSLIDWNSSKACPQASQT
jgi:hypothetical protein